MSKNKIKGMIEIIFALLVLFLSMWNPEVSVFLSVAALVIFGAAELLKGQNNKKVEEKNNIN